ATDALIVSLYAAGLTSLTREQQAIADVNADGAVTQEDAYIIAQMSVGFSRELAKQRVNSVAYKKWNQSAPHAFIVNGHVGINTTVADPVSKLTIDEAGVVNTTKNIPLGLIMTGSKDKTALALVSTNSAGVALPSLNNVGLYAYGTDYAGYFENGKIYSSGNVGIGVTAPSAKLEATASSGYTAQLSNSGTASNDYALRLDNATAAKSMNAGYGGLYVYSPGAASYGIHQAGGNAYNYFAGRVGVGTSSPLARLHAKSGSSGLFFTSILNNPNNDNGEYALGLMQGFDMTGFGPVGKGGMFISAANDGYGIFQAGGGKNYFIGKVGIETTDISTSSSMSLVTGGGIGAYQGAAKTHTVLSVTELISAPMSCTTACSPAACIFGAQIIGNAAPVFRSCSDPTNDRRCFCY
ncbi:MAG TPA: hypothetical protein PLO93_05165, partial [Candidatus Omnitrophota bacterium]|nr:hypothetical protein [Candidatus Omnitrophota bacterium]